MFTRNRIRVGLELTKPYAYSVDKFRSGNPIMLRARAQQWEVALLTSGVVESLATVTEIRLEVKPLDAAGYIDISEDPVILKIISAVDMNADLTQTEWDNDSGTTPWHCKLELSEAETSLSMTGAVRNKVGYGFVITGLTSQGIVTFGTGIVELQDDGGRTTADGPDVNPELYPTLDEFNAAMATKLSAGANEPGVNFTLTNADGWGIRFSMTEGANPEPKFIIVAPAS
jgi:hypothetical protein